MFKNCRNLFFFAIVYFLESNLISREPDVLSQFVENHLLIVESKMKDSPTLWLDVREGYLRNKTVYLSGVVMDSLDEELTGYHAAIRHLPKIDSLREESLTPFEVEFDFVIEKKPNFSKNYFSSSIK